MAAVREHSVNRHRVSSLCYALALHAAHRKPSLQPVFDVHSMPQKILKIEGKFWYEGGLRSLSKSIFPPLVADMTCSEGELNPMPGHAAGTATPVGIPVCYWSTRKTEG